MDWKKIGSMLVLAIFVIGMVPFTLAQNEENIDNLNSQYKIAKNQYNHAKTLYRAIVVRWDGYHDQFNHLTEAELSHEMTEEVRLYLMGVAELEIATLEFAGKIIDIYDFGEETLVGKIQDVVDEIEQDIIPRIESAETKAEFVEIAHDLLNIWTDAKHLLKISMGLATWYKLDHSIDKVEDILVRLKAKIEPSYLVNKDQLLEHIDDAMEKVDLARENADMAREKYHSASTVQEMNAMLVVADQFLNHTAEFLKGAYHGAKQVVHDAKKTEPGQTTPDQVAIIE